MINIAYFLENCGYMYKTDDGKYRIDIDDRGLAYLNNLIDNFYYEVRTREDECNDVFFRG